MPLDEKRGGGCTFSFMSDQSSNACVSDASLWRIQEYEWVLRFHLLVVFDCWDRWNRCPTHDVNPCSHHHVGFIFRHHPGILLVLLTTLFNVNWHLWWTWEHVLHHPYRRLLVVNCRSAYECITGQCNNHDNARTPVVSVIGIVRQRHIADENEKAMKIPQIGTPDLLMLSKEMLWTSSRYLHGSATQIGSSESWFNVSMR